MVVDPNVIGEHLDNYREADMEHSWEVSDRPYGTTLKIASINAQTLKKKTKRKLYQRQMSERNFAIVMVQESRAKTTGIIIEGEYIVVTAAADEKGSYGCEMWINMNTVMVKWGKGGEEKARPQPEDITLIWAEPTFIMAHIGGRVANVNIAALHVPQRKDKTKRKEWWQKVTQKIEEAKTGGNWIIGMDANAEPPALGDEVCGYIGVDPSEAYEAYSDVHEALKGWGMDPGHVSRVQ